MQEWLESEEEDRPEEPVDMPYEDPLGEVYPEDIGASRGGMRSKSRAGEGMPHLEDIEAIPPSAREALPSSAEGMMKPEPGTKEPISVFRQRASQVGQAAQQQVESGKGQAAGVMQRTAEELRHRTEGQGGMPQRIGSTAAETLDRTAGYLQEHSTGEIMDDAESYVRAHPVQTVLGAAAVGFIVGRLIR